MKFVRNFWTKLFIDGNEVKATGPRTKGGEMEVEFNFREEGNISKTKYIIKGEVIHDNQIHIRVLRSDGKITEILAETITNR
ncbi:MAG: hypothetical protein PHT94_00705 [Candidatus Nanoarchaeia archaeon]|nr:hypothetical protein [Candidatus Nanoarchaeia archaeon]